MIGAQILRVFDELAINNACLTIDEIKTRSSLERGLVIEIINRMVRADIVNRSEQACFCLSLDALEKRDDVVLMVLGAPTLQDQILRAMPAEGAIRTSALAEELGTSRKNISGAVGRLVTRRLVSKVTHARYQLTAAGRRLIESEAAITSARPDGMRPVTRPERRTLRDKLWKAMRLKVRFSRADILMLADAGDKDPRNNARLYIKALLGAGFLKVIKASPTRYELLTNNGPKTPIYRVSKQTVFDPNTGKEVACQ